MRVSNDAADVTSLLIFGNEVTIDSFCVTSLQWWLSLIVGSLLVAMVAIADSGLVTSLQWWLLPIAGSLLRYNGGYC